MNKPAFTVLSHLIVWLLFFTLILSVSTSMTGTVIIEKIITAEFIVFCLVYLFVFYFNNIVLFPSLYLRKKYTLYFSIVVALFTGVYFLKPFDRLIRDGEHNERGHLPPPTHASTPMPTPRGEILPPMHPHPDGPHKRRGPIVDISSIIIFLLVWLASTSLHLVRAWRSSQQRAIAAERDKKTAELAFLKAHINPHFLFNTLNNIYSLAITNHEQTAVSILKLSHIMRYVTESVEVDFISLESEVECMVDYVDLQKLRLSKKVYLDFSITGDPQNKTIAPLVLTSFIENAFKYGISNHHQSTITIKLFIEESQVTFYCQNRIFNEGFVYSREGLGLNNTIRRLEFLYPGKHRLDINTEKHLYTVQLTIQTA